MGGNRGGDRILICDDDPEITGVLSLLLADEGYEALCATSGEQALQHVSSGDIDLLLMEVMIPGIDGLSCLRRLRRTSDLPVILLSARDSDADKIMGLRCGADDYITKPFHPMELVARVRRTLMLHYPRGQDAGMVEEHREVILQNGPLLCDPGALIFRCRGRVIGLTRLEYRILYYMMQHKGMVVTTDQIYRDTWGEEVMPGADNTVAVHISHIRKKLRACTGRRFIEPIRGVGYIMEDLEVRSCPPQPAQ